jgi:ATP-binding cassette subfamily B protein
VGSKGSSADLGAVLPPVLLLAALTVVLSVVGAFTRELQDVLAVLVARRAQERVLRVASSVELRAFDTPAFHDRLARAALGAHLRPIEVVDGVLALIGALTGVVGVGLALLVVEPWLLPIALAAAVPLLLATARAGSVQFGFTLRMTPNDRERSYLFDLMTGRSAAAELRALDVGVELVARHARLYDQHVAELRRAARRRLRLNLEGAVAAAVISAATITLVLWLAVTGRMPLTEAGVALGAVVLISQRLSSAVAGAGQLYESARFLADMWSFIGPAPAPARPAEAPVALPFSRVRVEGVSFAYPGAFRPAVRDVSLEIGGGEVVALVGENGSGKTTLAKLLARLYRPDAGRIVIDGVDADDLDEDAVRRSVAIVFQDYLRFALSAADNVAVGDRRRMADFQAIVRAAQRAGIHEALSVLPAGYDTLLATEFEGGSDLSLGQWQRMALARAYFRDAPFVVLDEPTAALDPRAEHALHEQIRDLFADRSVLIISHRLSSVRSADRIYVLDGGELVESGTHETLMAAGGRYAELFSMQASAYALEQGVV